MSFLAGLWGRRDAAGADPDLPHADTVAIAGYARLGDKDVIARLPRLTQKELTAVDTYERAHGDRPVVLHKLRYLRGDEPVAGYDDLAPEDVPAALADADLVPLDLVRSYEQRLRARDRVLGDVEHLRQERRAADLAAARPPAR